MGDLIVYFMAVLFVIGGMLFLRKYLLKKFGANRPVNIKSGNYMKIIDRLALTSDKQLLLLEAGEKVLLVGVSLQKMETLAEFVKADFAVSADETEAESGGEDIKVASVGNFLAMMGEKLNFHNKGDKKN